MIVSVVGYSLTQDPVSFSDWKEKISFFIDDSLDNKADIVLFPELFLMGLSAYVESTSVQDELFKVAQLIEREVLPFLSKKISQKDVTVVLGSGPRIEGEEIKNSSPIFQKGKWFFQDKIYLTPWETDFSPGEEVKVFNVRGFKTAVVICFDSEQPDLALKLKAEGIDLILIPSATTNKNGSQRVNRCASARAVELGALVITCPLLGDSKCDLVDHNEGRIGFFLPAQESVSGEQEVYSEYSVGDIVTRNFEIGTEKLKELKVPSSETKPYLEPIKNRVRVSRS